MSRRIVWIILTVLVIAGLSLISLPGVLRCYAYRKLLATEGATDALRIVPAPFMLPDGGEMLTISLGYASVGMPKDLTLGAIRCPPDSEVVLIEIADGGLVLMPPFDGRSLFPGEDGYRHYLLSLQTTPRTMMNVFFMEGSTYTRYMQLVIAKTLHVGSADVVRTFEGDYLDGIVIRNNREEKTLVMIWSKDRRIAQGIQVRGKETGAVDRWLGPFLAAYRFTIPEVPEKSALREMIRNALQKHPRFVGTKEEIERK